MATNIVGSLFGISPEQLMLQRQARDVDEQVLSARMSATPGSMMSPSLAPFYQQATQQGQLIGKGVGALLGAQDPELQKVTAIKQLSSQFDLTTPQGMRQFAGALQSIAPNEAMMAAKRADEMDVSRATVTAKTREQLPTLAKLQAYRENLVAQYGPNDPRVSEVNAEIKGMAEGKGTKIIIPGEAQNKILREKRTGKLLDLEDTALAAQDTLQTVNDFRKIVGTAFTGVGSGAKLTAGQFANALGLEVSGTSETEQLNQLFAGLTTGQAKNLKGSLSDKDLKFLKEAVGTSGLTLTTLQNVISRIEREAMIDSKTFDLASQYEGDYSKMNLVELKKKAQQEVNTKFDKQKRLQELRAKQNQQ